MNKKKTRLRYGVEIVSDVRLPQIYLDFLESEIENDLKTERLKRTYESDWDTQNPTGFSKAKKVFEYSDANENINRYLDIQKARQSEPCRSIGKDITAYEKARQKIKDRTKNFDDSLKASFTKQFYRESDGTRIYYPQFRG